MSSSTVVLRLPRAVRDRDRVQGAVPAEPTTTTAPRTERERRSRLAAVADDVSPRVAGGLRHFIW